MFKMSFRRLVRILPRCYQKDRLVDYGIDPAKM